MPGHLGPQRPRVKKGGQQIEAGARGGTRRRRRARRRPAAAGWRSTLRSLAWPDQSGWGAAADRRDQQTPEPGAPWAMGANGIGQRELLAQPTRSWQWASTAARSVGAMT